MTYTPQHIKRWYETINLEMRPGLNYDDYYVACARFFRSTPVERSNFLYIMQHLQDSGEPDAVLLPVFTDDIFLYRYYILVHEGATKTLRMADMFASRMKSRGSLDPEQEHLYNDEHIQHVWSKSKLDRRVRMCQEAGVSIFCARHKYFPYDSPGSEELRDLFSEML